MEELKIQEKISKLKKCVRSTLQNIRDFLARRAVQLLFFLGAMYIRTRRGVGVLHIMIMSHIPYLVCQEFNKIGVKAHYLAVGRSWINFEEGGWDFHLEPNINFLDLLKKFLFICRIYAQHAIVHFHAITTMTTYPEQEFSMLKFAKRKLVFHFRGCDIRRKTSTVKASPKINCCKECDYPEEQCLNPTRFKRMRLARRYGDIFLVTTPDLLDNAPYARCSSFIAPPIKEFLGNIQTKEYPPKGPWRVYHATNHEGIDGTRYIVKAVEILRKEGFDIELIQPKRLPYKENLKLLSTCHISVGKLLMGYYANSQVEAMTMGIPTMCYIRPDFLEEIPDCPILVVRPNNFLERLRYYIMHPDALTEAGAHGPEFVQKYHDGQKITQNLAKLYLSLLQGDTTRLTDNPTKLNERFSDFIPSFGSS